MSDPPTKTENKTAILFIPGLTSREKKESLYKLSLEFEKLGAKQVKHFDKDNCSIKQFEINNRLIDVYEAYWADLIEDFTKMELTDKVPRGAYLLYYWLFSSIYQAFRESKLLVLTCTVFLLVFVGWYFFTVLLIFSQLIEKLDFLSQFKSLVGWVWLVNTFLVGLLPVSTSANLTNFFERYFEDGFTKYKIHERMSENLNLILSENYSNITVLGYSFGAIIGTKLLAELQEKQDISYITLGSPLKFFSFKSHRIKSELSKLVEDCKTKVDRWIEYYSESDQVCIKWLPIGRYDNLEIKTIQLYNERGKKIKKTSFASITGQCHSFYFYNQELLQKILLS